MLPAIVQTVGVGSVPAGCKPILNATCTRAKGPGYTQEGALLRVLRLLDTFTPLPSTDCERWQGRANQERVLGNGIPQGPTPHMSGLWTPLGTFLMSGSVIAGACRSG